MLKKSASFVLASLDGLFEHPAGYLGTIVIREIAAPYFGKYRVFWQPLERRRP
jgi:hypothetical protein